MASQQNDFTHEHRCQPHICMCTYLVLSIYLYIYLYLYEAMASLWCKLTYVKQKMRLETSLRCSTHINNLCHFSSLTYFISPIYRHSLYPMYFLMICKGYLRFSGLKDKYKHNFIIRVAELVVNFILT